MSREQLRTVLALTLGQGFRKGVSPLTGAKIHPLRQVLFSMGFMGLIFCVNVQRVPDAATFYRLLFGAAFGLVAFGVSPDASDVRQRNSDVLACRPVSGATLLACQSLSLCAIGLILTLAFGLPGVVASAVFLDVPAGLAVLEGLALCIQGMVVALLWLHGFRIALRWTSIERLRRVSHVGVIVMAFAISLGSWGLLSPVFSAMRFHGLSISKLGGTILAIVPSTWFAELPSTRFDLVSNLERLGVVLLLAMAFVAPWLVGLERSQQRFAEAVQGSIERSSATPARVRTSWSTSLLSSLRPLIRPQTRAVADAILRHAERDDLSRMRLLSQWAMAIAFFLIGLALQLGSRGRFGGSQGTWMLLYVSCWTLVEAVDSSRRSPQAAAGWIFFTGPLDPLRVVRGIQVAIALRALVLPMALTIVVLSLGTPAATAVLLVVSYLVGLRLAAATLCWARPSMPLSDSERMVPALVGYGLGLGLALLALAALAVVRSASEGGTPSGIGLVLAGIVATLLLTALIERRAAARLLALQHAT